MKFKQVLAFLSKFKQIDFMESNDKPKQDALLLARMPTPVAISLETLKNEQGYSMKKLNQAYARLDRSIWEGEDFDQLLKAI